MMGSKKTTNQTYNQTQTSAPPTWTLPGLTYAGDLVTQQLKDTAPGTPYSGNFVATPDPTRVAAQVDAYDHAASQAGNLADFSNTQLHDLFAPQDSSAQLQDAIKASIAPVFRQLQEQVLPGITNSALSSGAYTNDRALGVVPEQAIRDATTSAQNIASQLGYQGYQAEQDRNVQKAGLLPSLTNLIGQLSTSQGDIIGAGSQVEQQSQQDAINNALQQHQYDVQAPYEHIAPAAQLLALLSGNWGTQTMNGSSKTTEKTGGLGPILQGAMGLASMAASMGAFGPLGAAAGAAGGGGGTLAGGSLFSGTNLSKIFSSPAPSFG